MVVSLYIRWFSALDEGGRGDTFHGDGLVVINRYYGEAHLVKLGSALDNQVY